MVAENKSIESYDIIDHMKTEDTYYYEHVDSLIISVSRIIDEIENKGYYGPEDEIELNALTDLLEQLKSLEHGS